MRSRAKKRKRNLQIAIIAVGVGLFALCLIGTVVAYLVWPKGGILARTAPAGYASVHEPDGRFSVFVPGQAKKEIIRNPLTQMEEPGHYMWYIGTGEPNAVSPTGYVRSDRVNEGFNPGTGPDDLTALIKPYDWISDLFLMEGKYEIKSKTAIVLDNRPAAEVRYQEKFNPMGGPGEEMWKEHNRKVKEELDRNGKRGIYLVTVFGRQVIFIHLIQRGRYPDDQILEAIKQSFRFVD